MLFRFTSDDNTIRLENVKDSEIKFRHFSGEKDPRDKYSKEGYRYFNIALPDDVADELMVNGWRVKPGKEKDDGTRYPSMINVKVNFNSRKPPVITRWTSNGPVNITEDLAKDLDTDVIDSAALLIYGYLGTNSPDGKRTPYLTNMRYKIEEDPFKGLYEDIEDDEDFNDL